MVSEVELAVPPGHGQLRLWGRSQSDWFALVQWLAQCNDHRRHGGEHRSAVFCTGWIGADHVAPVDGEDYSSVPRIELSISPQQWPSRLRIGVDSHGSDFYFGLLDGSPIIAPPGITWMVGHGSLYG
jgi:hypothetical protein